MHNLVIGNTSQLCYYFPESYDKISSRNIIFEDIKSRKYDTIWIAFAEQRTFLNEIDFIDVNVNYTIDVINNLKDCCNKLYIFSTSELWNQYDGPIDLSLPYKYDYTPYIKSKELLCNYIISNKDIYKNVIIIYPFNFNSVYRKRGFLFHKIFNSIINKTKEEIGNINFNRDLIHPEILVNESILSNSDRIIGSGGLFNVKNFVEDIFKELHLNINDYVTFKEENFINNRRSEYYNKEKLCRYEDLLALTTKEIKKFI
jgi:nucleoside-diphosphate-sugar epimerase